MGWVALHFEELGKLYTGPLEILHVTVEYHVCLGSISSQLIWDNNESPLEP